MYDGRPEAAVNAPAPRPSGRYLFIDALRGLAALAVVVFHAKEGGHIDALVAVLPRPLVAVIGHGHLGVQIFSC
jgi:peptidoglycan/LPS O-acetylase OafA/YrhL